jgi:hypothetical protein
MEKVDHKFEGTHNVPGFLDALRTAAVTLTPWTTGGFQSGKYQSLFAEVGHKKAEVGRRFTKDIKLWMKKLTTSSTVIAE